MQQLTRLTSTNWKANIDLAMTGRFKSLLLRFACLLTVLGICCPASGSPVLRDWRLSPVNHRRVSDPNPRETDIASLPDGYAPILNSSVAYKLYKGKGVTWTQARELCKRDGARLAVADDQEMYKYLIANNAYKVHVGIYYEAFKGWISIRDGSTVRNIPWRSGQPDNSGGCVWIGTVDGVLETIDCGVTTSHYACEIPILKKDSATHIVQQI